MKSHPIIKSTYEYGFHNPESSVFRTPKGLSREIVEAISHYKMEPDWMRQFRLQALMTFDQKQVPTWGADLSGINFDNLYYYISPSEKKSRTWEDVPADIKNTYDRIGIPEAEKKFLAGVGAQYDSEVIYHNLKKQWEDQGVIFVDTDTALKKYPDIFRQYFGTIIPPADNKFAALNSAVWSGGSFVYVPKGVQVSIPLQAYFRINAANMGQFERTLIIAEEGSYVHYVEGCTAPIYSTDSLHSAVVEIIVNKGARVRYTTIQNWSNNVYNLVTKRMMVEEEGFGEWIDGNLGSKATMKYPSVILSGKGARGEVLSLAFAGKGQHQDAGGKAIHLAPFTTSTITSKSVSVHGGRSSYRGMVKIINGAKGAKSFVRCDALLLDELSRSDTYPVNIINERDVTMGHEASVSKIGEQQLFYLMSRGLSEAQATSLIVNGFIEPIVKELPLEYAVELNRLINMSMEGSVDKAILMNNEIIVKENQELVLPILWLGEETQLLRNVILAGIGAKITLLALLLGKKTQNLDLKINIYHQKPQTQSCIIVKGAMDEFSSINFDGLVKIEPGAKGTNAWLAAHILLLSDKAKGRAVPSLEIEENDIKAGHAATVGRVNDLELFYLMSRGLSENTAKALIVQGFLESIIKDFPERLAAKARKEIAYEKY